MLLEPQPIVAIADDAEHGARHAGDDLRARSRAAGRVLCIARQPPSGRRSALTAARPSRRGARRHRVDAEMADVDACGRRNAGWLRRKPLARELRDRDQPLGAIERGALNPRQRLPRLDAAEHRHQRGAARREGERGRRQMQMDSRSPSCAVRTTPPRRTRRRHETRRSAAGASHALAPSSRLRRAGSCSASTVASSKVSATRRASLEMPSRAGQIRRQDDDGPRHASVTPSRDGPSPERWRPTRIARGKGGRALAHAGAARRIVRERADRGGDGRCGLLDPEAALARFNLAARAGPRHDDRHPGRQRFDDREPEALRVRALDHDVRVAQQRPFVRPRSRVERVHGAGVRRTAVAQIRHQPVLVGPGEHEV